MSERQLSLPLGHRAARIDRGPDDPARSDDERVPSAADRTPAADAAAGDRRVSPTPERKREFAARLRALSDGRIVDLTLTRNRSTFLSSKPIRRPGDRRKGLAQHVAVRLHECFLDAPEDIVQAVVDFASKRLTRQRRRDTLGALRSYFDEQGPPPAPRQRKTVALDPVGRHHDLRPLVAELNRAYFQDQLDVLVTWGAPVRRRRRRRRTIQLGSYQDETRTVRIHPILDRPEVPRYVIEAVLHHEMVHAVVPAEPSRTGTRRRVHTEEFRKREREYRQLERAERWLERNLFRMMGKVERELARRGS